MIKTSPKVHFLNYKVYDNVDIFKISFRVSNHVSSSSLNLMSAFGRGMTEKKEKREEEKMLIFHN